MQRGKPGAKFVYDGKRIQPVYERNTQDFNSTYIYSMHNQFYPPYNRISNSHLDLSSQVISMKPSSLDLPINQCCTKFMQLCINKLRSPVGSLCWSPDGRRVMSGLCSGEITMWNGQTYNFETILQAHSFPIKSMKWSHNKQLLITADANGIVKYWNSAMNNLYEIPIHSSPIKDLSFCYNDSKFTTASDDATIKIVDVFRSETERTLTGHNWDVRRAQFHPQKALIASGGKDNLIKLWDPRENSALTTFHYHKNTILGLCWFQDNYLLSGGKDQVIKMLDIRTMKEIFTYKDPKENEYVSVKSPPVANTNTRQSFNPINPLNTDITALTTHNNLIISGSGSGDINYWEPFNDKPIATTDRKHDNTVWTLDMHPSGHCLASGAADYQVRFWVRERYDSTDEKKEEENNVENNTAGTIPGLNL